MIDTDTASDDAVALLLAACTPGVHIRAVTTVAGNVPVAQATRNAIVTLDVVGRADVPVYQGLDRPILRPLETAQYVHGEDGLGGTAVPEPSRGPAAEHAVEAILAIAKQEQGQHLLVTLGPLSTIATALLVEPTLLQRFTGVVLMGGAFDAVGNAHPVGEYNVWADPEAARIVVDAPGTKTFVGWDIARRYAVLHPHEQDELRALGPKGSFAIDVNAAVRAFAASLGGQGAFVLPDPIAMAIALDPSVATGSHEAHVSVGLDDASRGGTFVDRRPRTAPPNATIVTAVDEARFKAMLRAACG